MNDSNHILCERISMARNLRKMTQLDLAEAANVPQSQISKIESKKTTDPGVSVVISLAGALDTPLDLLINGTMDELLSHLTRSGQRATHQALSAPTTDHATSYGQEVLTKNPMRVNRFQGENVLPNPNQIIFGDSGVGKTYMVKSQLLEWAEYGNGFTVIDVHNEYVDTAKITRATAVMLDGENNFRINPLDLTLALPSLEEYTADDAFRLGNIISQHIEFLVNHFFTKLHRRGYSGMEIEVLTRALQQLYQQHGYDLETGLGLTKEQWIKGPALSAEMPTLSDLRALMTRTYRQSQDQSVVRSALLVWLEVLSGFCLPFTPGLYLDEATDMPSFAESESMVIGFNASDSLRPAISNLLLYYAVQKTHYLVDSDTVPGATIPLRPRHQIVMPATDPDGYLEYVVRNSRAFGIGINVIVESLDKFLANRHKSSAITRNCASRIVMLINDAGQEEEKKQLAELVGLTPSELEAMENFHKGDYIGIFDKHRIIGTLYSL